MTGWRHPQIGSAIDRTQPRSFTFDGRHIAGFSGDTLASALLANGVHILGRSFKYHRPRGIWGMGADEPNAIFDIRLGREHRPNQRATTTLLEDGMVVTSVNSTPNAGQDRFQIIDWLHRFLPAGFYYKTFMAFNWMRYEPLIRRLAGLGRVEPSYAPPADALHLDAVCDVLIVGAGPSGLAAARAAAHSGRAVWLIDDAAQIGGSLHRRNGQIDGSHWTEFANATRDIVLDAGGRVLSNTTVWGVFDHNVFSAWVRTIDAPDQHLRIRATDVVFATGAIERPLWFANNDLPGVMSCEAALHFLQVYGALPGQRIVIATANDASYAVASALVKAGADVTLIDQREEAPDANGFAQIKGGILTAARGKTHVRSAVVNGQDIACDTILCSGGYTPTVHLWCQSGGKLDWSDDQDALIPRPGTSVHKSVGSAAGQFGLQAALATGHALYGSGNGPQADEATPPSLAPVRPDPALPGRQWIDLQNDVTLKNVDLAAREGFTSVEHLKRYTTLGMATDQGRTSNFAGLAAMAAVTGQTIPQTGTTTYRPPFEPVPLGVIAGRRRGDLFNPPKRLALEAKHRDMGAHFREYGGWLRPSVYGSGLEADVAQAEAKAARTTAAVFDASPLGKLEVIGPKAGALLDFTGYMRMSTLKPGRARYGLMLAETGIVYDDGVVLRLDEHRFIVSASSSHVDGVRARLEDARQDRIGHEGVYIHDVTQGLVTLTVTGPKALEVIQDAGIEVPELPHMGVLETTLNGHLLRVARISFTGDRSYELTVPALHADDLRKALDASLRLAGGRWIGLEAVMILRAEKGFILIGKDTDGNTMPHDLGWLGAMTNREDEYLGKRALFTPEGQSAARRQWVGLQVADEDATLETGSHLIPTDGPRRSLGFVTSSYFSPNLDRPIALGLLENGRARVGTTVGCFNDGIVKSVKVVDACAFDPNRSRLNG